MPEPAEKIESVHDQIEEALLGRRAEWPSHGGPYTNFTPLEVRVVKAVLRLARDADVAQARIVELESRLAKLEPPPAPPLDDRHTAYKAAGIVGSKGSLI